jgi:integrase
MKVAKPYPYLYADVDRQGVKRWRLRAPGRPTTTIKGDYGSAEFAANYRAAIERDSVRPTVGSAKHGTFNALGRSYLRSTAFSELAPESQRKRRYLVELFLGSFGHLPVASFQRHHVKLFMERYASKPGMARNTLSMLRVLIALAIEDGIRADDPTTGIKRPKLSKEGWRSWEYAEIEQYEARHPIGSQARLALALALYTGQRAGDLVRMGKQHVRDGQISVVQQKTGTRVWIPLHPDLVAVLDATPSDQLLYLTSGHGKPYANAKTFGNAMNRWAKEAGLAGCQLHGLRKSCARWLAEAGCSALEIMSITGHKSLAEVERYVRAANQKLMAETATGKIKRTPTYPRRDHSYPREKKV